MKISYKTQFSFSCFFRRYSAYKTFMYGLNK